MGLAALAVLTLGGVTEVKAASTTEIPEGWTSVRFNNDVRYSQWIINSRINDFYANSTHVGFGVFNGSGSQVTTPVKGKSSLDYVPGLVAKAVVENVKQNAAYSWAAPWYYNMKWFCETYYNQFTDNGKKGKSQDDLNGAKMFFALKDLTASGTYADATVNGHCTTAMGTALSGLDKLNETYIIGGSASGISAETAQTLGMYGGWFHKNTYVDQMWCDGLYMGPALLAQLINEYGSYSQINTNDGEDDWDLITRLFTISWNQLYDSNTGLLYHAFTANPKDDASAAWAGISNTTGSEVYHSAAFWGRACGWYFLALVDILEQMDAAGKSGTTNYATLKGYLNSLAAGLANYQDEDTGCWYQVLDEKDEALSGNYLESSCTAIFTAAYLKGMRLGYYTADYTTVAQKAYEGCVNQFMMFDNSDDAQLVHCCASAGLGGSNNRSGSRSYYITGSDVDQRNTYTEGKVLGGFILAATEYERAYQASKAILFSTDLKASYDLEANGSISIEACGADDAEISYEWYKVGEANAIATGATFTPTASGSYYCKATSGTTTIQSSTTNVTVPGVDTETPVFTTDLAATATATVGTAKTLTVAASHADGYQWYSNTTASNTSGTEIENATSASYTFTPSAAGTLYYYCVATNSNATGTQSVASAVCTVTVSEAPAETTYTVTFNATTNGGTCATASLTQASSGASITLPTATKSGYTFNGWYTASTGGTLKGAANASYTPTANETLYAQFTENSGTGGEGDCTIKIGNSNANSYAATFTSSSTNASVTASATAFTMGSGTTSSNSSYSSATAPYSIKYKPSSDINTSEYSDNYSISAPFTVASGYTFAPSSISATIVTEAAGYTYQAILTDGTTTYTSNDVSSSTNGVSTFTFPSLSGTALSGTVTFKIRYKSTASNKKYFVVNLPITISGEVASSSTPTPTTYTVSYNMNGHGTAIDAVEGVTALPSTLPTPEATGYTFGGWYTNSGLTSAATAGASISADTELYAKWTANTYSVHFDANGGEGSMTNESFTYGTAKALTANAFTRTGYKFDGWATSANGAKVYDDEESVSNLTATNDATVDLYAHWTEKAAATVSINPASGNVTVGSTLDISNYVTAGSSTGAIGYSTGDATKATVTSAGVITGVAEGSATIYVTQQEDDDYKTGSVTFTVTVTAAPTPVTNYTVKFYNGETQFGDSQTIEEGSTVSAPTTNPTKDGYTFKGWALENGSTVRVTFPYPIYEDVNFYAVWSNTTSGGGGEDETIFSAAGAGSSNLSVPGNTTNQEITSTNATITGGSLYVTNVNSSAKNMIQNQGNKKCFGLMDDGSYFKIVLNNSKVFEAGDQINASYYFSGSNTTRALWLSNGNTRPSSAPSTVLSATPSTSGWHDLSTYTVTNNDGICGQNTIYIYRATGNGNTYFTDFTITREGQGDEITLETVSDYEDFESYAGENKTVTFKRNFNNGKWTTLVLPFSATTAQVVAAFEYPNDCEFANIKSMTVTDQGTGSISYVTTNHITANTPILAKIKPNDGLSGKEGFTADEYVFSGVTVVNPESADAVTATSTDGNVRMYGVYKNTAKADINESSFYFIAGGKFYDKSWLSNMTPFTAYIVPTGVNTQSIKSISFADDATGIENLNVNPNRNSLSTGEGWGEVYNLAGQKVGKGYKGMVISKGRKIIDN